MRRIIPDKARIYIAWVVGVLTFYGAICFAALISRLIGVPLSIGECYEDGCSTVTTFGFSVFLLAAVVSWRVGEFSGHFDVGTKYTKKNNLDFLLCVLCLASISLIGIIRFKVFGRYLGSNLWIAAEISWAVFMCYLFIKIRGKLNGSVSP